MGLHTIKKESVANQVFEQLKGQILNQAWLPGNKLPSETELSSILGVSRVSIRNALQRLNTLGLIETRLGDGSYVKEANIGDQIKAALIPNIYLQAHSVKEVLQFRSVIEVETAALAARNASAQNIQKMKSIFQKQLNHDKQDVAFAKYDLDFHFAIAESTENSLIIAMYEILRDILTKTMLRTVSSIGTEIALPYHRRLIEAIEAGDELLAAKAMKEHMAATYEQFSKIIDIDGNCETV